MRERALAHIYRDFCRAERQTDVFLNDEEYPLEAGELIIINSNEIHSIYAPEKK